MQVCRHIWDNIIKDLSYFMFFNKSAQRVSKKRFYVYVYTSKINYWKFTGVIYSDKFIVQKTVYQIPLSILKMKIWETTLMKNLFSLEFFNLTPVGNFGSFFLNVVLISLLIPFKLRERDRNYKNWLSLIRN